MNDGALADPLAVLQRIRQPRPTPAPTDGQVQQRCELCTEPIPGEHGHLVDVQARNLLCACRGCYLLFTAGGTRYRAVPDRYVAFEAFELSAGQWDALQIPVGVAFFFLNSSIGRVAAFYPGPAGATESELALDAWDQIVASNPLLATLQPDVEAVLLRAERDGSGAECFLVPIDACYELVGHLRRLWRGFDGGRDAHEAMEVFFERVRARAR